MAETNVTFPPAAPSPIAPDSSIQAIALAMVRGVIQLLAGVGFTWALTVSGSQQTMIATALVALATLVWSGWQKLKAARAAEKMARGRERDAAVASSRATLATGVATPLTVTVTDTTPAGQPNIGVTQRVGNTEVALATITSADAAAR